MDTKRFSRVGFTVHFLLLIAAFMIGWVHSTHAQGSHLPTHRYSFANPAGAATDGSVVADSVGTADGTVRGAGATFTGTRVTLPGGSSATQGYIDLPNGLFSTNSTNSGGSGQVTLEAFARVTGNRNWSRIFDFGSSGFQEITGPGGSGNGERYIMLSAQVGGDVNSLRFEMTGAAGFPNGQNFTLDFPTTFNQDVHFVMTWDEATGDIRMYQNGLLAAQATRTATMTNIQDVNVWLGRSNWTADDNMQGEFDEFRIYDRVLAPDQARGNFFVGPESFATGAVRVVLQPTSVVTNEARPIGFATFGAGDLPITYQWFKNGAPIPGATSSTYSNASVLVGDNGAQFFAVVSNNIAGTPYTATSQVATLTVNGDTNPPTILLARINTPNQLEVIFSEAIRTQDATNLANFALSGPSAPAITGLAVGADATRVLLTLGGPLTPCEFYTVTVSGVRDLSVTGNVIAPGSSSTVWHYALPGMTHRYTFNNGGAADATSNAVPDIVGTAHGIVQNGSGTTRFTGSRVTLSGGPSTTAPYVDLPNGLLSVNSTNNGGSGKVTFEGWAKVTAARNWARILDFGISGGGEFMSPGPPPPSEGQQYFFYSASIGTDVNRRRVDVTARNLSIGGGSEFTTSTFNQDVHFVITWDETTGVLIAYENGVQVGTFTTPAAMSQISDVNVWLGRSNWVNDDNMQGEFDEFRIYNTILSVADAQRNFAGGADNNFGALLALNLALTTNSLVTNTVGTVRVLGSFSNAGTQDLAAAGCVVYSSTDSNIVYISSDGFIHAVNAGTATVTASLGGLMDSEVIEVTADATPPFLISSRANSANQIEVVFSEPLDLGTAEEAGNYRVIWTGVTNDTFLSVQRQANQSRIIITLNNPLPLCDYITVLVSFVADQSPLFNQIAENSPISFYHFQPTGLTHRYTFNNPAAANAESAAILDTVGTANGVVLGAGGTFTGGRLTLPGGPSGGSAYVDLPNGLLTQNSTNNAGSGQVSIEGWVRVTGNRAWSRIFDFGSSGPCPGETPPCPAGGEITMPGGTGSGIDYFMYSAQVNVDTAAHRLEIQNRDVAGNPGTMTVDHGTTFNQLNHFVITWDEATGVIRAYENGNLVISSGTSVPMSAINDVNVWLGRSNWTGDQNMQGEFDEFRFYNRVLTLAEVQRNRAVGPDNNFGSISNVNIVLASTNLVTNTVAPLSVFAGFSNAGTQELASSGCVFYSSTDSNVVFVTSDGVVHAVNAGTATIRAEIGGVFDTQVITVGADAVAPTLVSARALTTTTIELMFSEPVAEGAAETIGNYSVSSASGPIAIASVQLLADATKVLITLATPMPCEYLTVRVTGVTDASPGANVIAPNSPISFTHYVPNGLQHRYTFNNLAAADASGAIVQDAVGTAHGMVLGAGASFNGQRLLLSGGPSATAAYVDLPNRLVSTNGRANRGSGQFTVEGWVKVTGVRNWARIVDFGSGTGGELLGPGGTGNGADYLFFSASEGMNANRHITVVRDVEAAPDGSASGSDTSVGINTATFNQDFHFAVTWDEVTSTVRVYENGVPVGTFTTTAKMSDINDINAWLGRSNWTGDQNMQGEFDEVRLYNRVLTAAELNLNRTVGPDNNFGQPLSLTVVQTNHVQIGDGLHPAALINFTSVSNVDFAPSGCVIFQSSNPSVLAVEAGIVHAVGLGTANLTSSFGGLTNVMAVTVGYQMQFTGLTPGTVYDVQFTTQLNSPIAWTTIGSQVAAADGTITFEDTTARGPQAFYRAVRNPSQP